MVYEKKAEITIFLTLICMSVCSLIYLVINGTKNQSLLLQSEILSDAAVNSVFSEYNTDLYKTFGLIYVDTRYKNSSGGDEIFIKHVENYFNAGMPDDGNMFYLKVDSVEPVEVIHMCDDDYESLSRQIILYERVNGFLGEKDDAINKYINDFFLGDLYIIPEDELCNPQEDFLYNLGLLSDVRKLELLAEAIERYMKSEYDSSFSNEYLIDSAKVSIDLSGKGGFSFHTVKSFSLSINDY